MIMLAYRNLGVNCSLDLLQDHLAVHRAIDELDGNLLSIPFDFSCTVHGTDTATTNASDNLVRTNLVPDYRVNLIRCNWVGLWSVTAIRSNGCCLIAMKASGAVAGQSAQGFLGDLLILNGF